MYEDVIRELADGNRHSVESLDLDESQVPRLTAYMDELGIEYSLGGGVLQIVGSLELLQANRMRAYMDERARDLLQEIEIHWSIDSTNTYLLQKTATQKCHGEVSIAEQQTQGRGRRGKNWVSPFGKNLYMSIAWRMPTSGESVDGLSLAVGVGVVRGLVACGVEGAQLKWPNDLLVDGSKLGGILIEVSNPKLEVVDVIVGVGINLQMPVDSGRTIDQNWTDMTRVTGIRISRNLVAAKLLDNLLVMLSTFPEMGFKSYRREWQGYDAFKDMAVEVHIGNETVAGIGKGVDDRGALCLQTETGIRHFIGGEASLRVLAT
ncbi:MAG: biotin--[acetyl-CoA-carboxylase] ligase [Arenicellales bacterium]|jgi:BirA family biotin operon repressor/biotin-[acetyl-CoA-carboxylase] ligase|nr:biotin--[acetyl-CoA-carboxylase] ligase [Arenicellales bacterium]|tara:strand:- start:1305 stop:2264 length:960 start_codon:yes stop_codon:yes gene_type:complete